MSELINPTVAAAFWQCLVVAIAASSVAMTVTQTELFRPMREWIVGKNAMMGHLFHCFYCFSHWTVFAGIAVYRPVLISSGAIWVDWIVSAFFTLTLASFVCGLMFKVFHAAMTKKMMEVDVKTKLGLDK